MPDDLGDFEPEILRRINTVTARPGYPPRACPLFEPPTVKDASHTCAVTCPAWPSEDRDRFMQLDWADTPTDPDAELVVSETPSFTEVGWSYRAAPARALPARVSWWRVLWSRLLLRLVRRRR